MKTSHEYFVEFQKHDPAPKELKKLQIGIGDDLYSSMLTRVKWIKGKGGHK